MHTLKLNIEVYNAKSVFKDFVLYELGNSDLKILPVAEKQSAILAGKTIYDAKEYMAATRQTMPIILLAVLGVTSLASLAGIVVVLRIYSKKRTQNDVEIGG